MPERPNAPASRPFDAVLVVSFGGPGGPADVRPFLANVLEGRRVSPERVEEVAGNYERFGGISPLTELTKAQARGLHANLAGAGLDLPVYVGMRNWHPFLADTLADMARAGVRRAIGFITAAHHCYSSCQQYKENVRDARAELRRRDLPDIAFTYVSSWFDHPAFIDTWARSITDAWHHLPADVRDEARIVFTAHSLPERMAKTCAYQAQLHTTARLIMEHLARSETFAGVEPVSGSSAAYDLVYQSRSGRPQDPWLGPDIGEHLRTEHARGLRAAVVAPIGFVCDHIEVLYDLDTQAAEIAREISLPMTRAQTPNAEAGFVHMMTDVVMQTWTRYATFPPLPIVAS